MLTIKTILITLLSYILVKQLIKYAHKLELFDIPNERSHHCSITPRGGGIGFVSAFFIGTILFQYNYFLEYWYIFASIFLVFLVGIYDDKFEVSAKLKFIVIFISVFILWLNGLTINSFGNWYGYELTLPSLVALIFSMFALAGFTNALNLIDGIDGLSSSISIVILTFFAFIGYEYNDNFIFTLSIFSIASIAGFLVLNWNPAKIFMGDSGSLTLGFIISVLSLLSLKYIHPIAILYLAAVPILDTLIVMTRRIRRGKSPFLPDKTHIHHIMVKFFDMNVKRTVLFLVLLQIIFSSIGYIIFDAINHMQKSHNLPLFALLGFIILFVLFYMIFTGIKKRQLLEESQKTNK